MKNSKVTGPGANVFGHGVKPAVPSNKGIRVHPVPHARAAKAKTSGPALATYPHAPTDIATAGKPR